MAKSIVIYTSKRGSTRQYAEWIAEDLGCKALPLSDAKGIDLHEYDCVIYGGWIRGSGIVDFDKFAKMLDDEIKCLCTSSAEDMTLRPSPASISSS